MRRINYKSDIPPLLLSLKVDENQITVPDCDFIVRFYIDGYEGRHYDCSHIGGVWSNCEPSEDGTKLVCYINNQRLGIGELCAEFHYIRPERRYSDGSQKSVVIIGSTELGVELVEDNGDAVTEAAIDVTLPFIYRTAYEIARDHGYTGTAEDFYGALASVVGIADAEKKRVTAEITRNANEQERIENEENRLNAESERVNAEAQRVRNEAIRGDAESDRVEQEEDRKAKFEEITGFIATVRANEGNRESNERERQANEDTRITEEAKRVEAEKKRATEFEQQKLDLSGKIDRSGDEMGGDLIFTDNAGVSFNTSNGGAHTMFNDTDDVAKFTADNGDTFEFKQNETPSKNSSAVVVSKNLYNALDMTLESMGSALDGDAAYRAEAGDKIFNPDTCKIQIYNSTIGGFEDLCDPIDGKLYANKMTGYIYRWDTKTKKMVFVGGVKAYTKGEADSRFAKLDDATQRVKAKELEASNSVTTKSMWIGDEGLLLSGDGNGHLTVEQDEVITDVTLNEKLATKADDVAYGVEWNNGQPTGEMQETIVKEATKNTTIATLFLAQSYNALESEVEKKAYKTELDTKVDKTDIVQNTGQSTTSVMSQKAVTDAIATEETRAREAEENLVGKVTELSAEVSEETIIREERRIDLLIDTAFNAYGLKLGDKFTSTAGPASGIASNMFIVQEGEVYHLKGRGNKYAYKGYFVTNADNVVIQIIDNNVEYDLDLVIGQGANYLFVNCVNYNEDVDGVWKVKAESLKDVVLQMQSEGSAETIVDTIDMSNKIVVGYAYNLGGNSVGQKYTSAPGTSATSAYAHIAVNHNSKYEIRGKGSEYAFRFYAFLDANSTILELSTRAYNTRNDALVLTPPSSAAMLIVNYTDYDASLDSLIRKDSYNVADSIKLIYKPLNGTNIVCFGDSITQFNGIRMRYSDYLEENGANVVNVGIGGTQIRQRATPSANPTSVEQAYGGLDIASLVNAAASNDYSIVEASASYIQSNATPQYNPIDVIEKLKSIDWNKVAIVTILGGTNDWNNGNNLGEATDENATSTLGALNHIIKTLLTAYPHLRVYVFTPLVRYVASSLAERTDATWAGTMTNGEDKTLLDYVDAIKYVAENNCIPVCDMYRTMGWNKYNFSQYFNDDDGVHPYKGFKEIADRMQSFILSNRGKNGGGNATKKRGGG